MTETLLLESPAAVKSLISNIDTIISDCDGVNWISEKPIEGAAEFFKKMRSIGKRIIFATNNSTKSRELLLSKLNSLGFESTMDEIMVNTYATAIALRKLSFTGKVFCIGSSVLRAEIEAAGFAVVPSSKYINDHIEESKLINPDTIHLESIAIDPEVSAVVIGAAPNVSAIKLIKACTYASRVSPDCVMCTNTDFAFPGPNGLVVPDNGSYVELIEKVSKRKIASVGKPSKIFYECIKHIHPDINPSRTLIIGDQCHTDIALGFNNGIKYTLLVGTGIHNLTDVENFASDKLYHLIPSHFAPSLKDINFLLSDESD